MRFGFQSPSSTSVLPPRTMYLPPYFSTVAAGELLVFFVPNGIDDVDFNDDVGRHCSNS